MSHPIYSRQQLTNRGLVKVKKVAGDLGVVPTGDKRLIQSWVDAIIEHQSKTVQQVEVEAIIEYDGESYEGLTQPYMVVVAGKVVHVSASYMQAERYCVQKGYKIVEQQSLAQKELETELESQSVATSEEVQFVDITFGYYEAWDASKNVCATIEYFSQDDESWYSVSTGNGVFIASSWEEAKAIVLEDERGSGRIAPTAVTPTCPIRVSTPIEEIGLDIENTFDTNEYGQIYSVRKHGVFIGFIFKDEEMGWTLNRQDYNYDWLAIASQLVSLTKQLTYAYA